MTLRQYATFVYNLLTIKDESPYIINRRIKGGIQKMNDSYQITTDAYKNVRYAIVKQAIDDYKRALRRGKEAEIKAIERWFLSEWGEFLSDNKGAYIIEKVKSEERKKGGNNGRKKHKTNNKQRQKSLLYNVRTVPARSCAGTEKSGLQNKGG